jgi:hypothetical protein
MVSDLLKFAANKLTMKIQVTTGMTIAALQQAFSACFPNLALAFFSKPHEIFQSSPVKYLLTDSSLSLERIEKHPHNGAVEVYADITVADLEQFFEQEFGLHVQIFRKTGNTWQETTLSDQLTLGAQNAFSMEEAAVESQSSLSRHNTRTEWFLG